MRTKKKHRSKRLPLACLLIVLAGGYAGWVLTRPPLTVRPTLRSAQLQIQTTAQHMVWPVGVQAAVGYPGTDILLTNGPTKPLPTASTAKILSALSILQAKPLLAGQQGPTITLSASDVAIYNNYVAQEGSVVPVTAGEQISEYQMLEAMLLPSANNMADSLAIWAFGSLSAYSDYANKYALQLGLKNTHAGIDASGFDPSTTSTAADLVKLGNAAIQNPVLAQIVSESSADGIPNAGTVKNVNFLLGQDGIVGVKTGNTDQAGGVFISASRATIAGKPITTVTAVIGAPTLFEALSDSAPLVVSAQKNETQAMLLSNGAAVGSYHLPWGGSVAAVIAQPLNQQAIGGDNLEASVKLSSVRVDTPAQTTVGNVQTQASLLSASQSTPVLLKQPIGQPPLWWRLLHPQF